MNYFPVNSVAHQSESNKMNQGSGGNASFVAQTAIESNRRKLESDREKEDEHFSASIKAVDAPTLNPKIEFSLLYWSHKNCLRFRSTRILTGSFTA